MHRLSRPDMEWVEKAVAEEVNRGQLVKGSSEWGFPAFPTKEAAAHKAIKRKRRVVVDYRALNRVTVRKVFLIPNSDQIKSCVAGSKFISVGDAKEGFNQVENEPESNFSSIIYLFNYPKVNFQFTKSWPASASLSSSSSSTRMVLYFIHHKIQR